MNTKKEISHTIENEIIDLVIKSPSILEKLRKIIQGDCQSKLYKKQYSPAVPHELIEAQIGKLMVSYENDSTIMVKARKKPSIPYDCRQLGFRDNQAKGWRFLINVLETPPHTFHFGTAYIYPDGSRSNRIKNKSYDAGWKVCDELCKKLFRFFKKEFGLEFPSEFKLYEKTKTSHPGERRFKFQIGIPISHSTERNGGVVSGKTDEEQFKSHYGDFCEPQLKREIMNLNRDYSADSKVHNVAPDNLVLAFKVGKEKFGWKDNFIRELLLE